MKETRVVAMKDEGRVVHEINVRVGVRVPDQYDIKVQQRDKEGGYWVTVGELL